MESKIKRSKNINAFYLRHKSVFTVKTILTFLVLVLFLSVFSGVLNRYRTHENSKIQGNGRKDAYCIADHLDYKELTPEERNKHLDILKESGASWVRFDFEALRFIKDGKVSDFSYYDQIILGLKERNIGVVAVLPQWGETDDFNYKKVIDSPERYGDYAKVLASYLKSTGINFIIEVGNEPNDPGFWPNRSPKIYTEYLVAAYDSVKSVDENILVSTGGVVMYYNTLNLVDRQFNALNWLKGMYKEGVKKEDQYHPNENKLHFDIYAVHLYTGNNNIAGYIKVLRDIKSYIRSQNDNAGLAITEIGWPTGGDGDSENVSEEKQASLVRGTLSEFAESPVLNSEVVCYYNLVNKGDSEDMEDNYGLVNEDLTKKESFEAFKELTSP